MREERERQTQRERERERESQHNSLPSQANPDKMLYKSEDNFGTSSLEHAVITKSTDIVDAILESYVHPLEKE